MDCKKWCLYERMKIRGLDDVSKESCFWSGAGRSFFHFDDYKDIPVLFCMFMHVFINQVWGTNGIVWFTESERKQRSECENTRLSHMCDFYREKEKREATFKIAQLVHTITKHYRSEDLLFLKKLIFLSCKDWLNWSKVT